jgi:hypothetical protein
MDVRLLTICCLLGCLWLPIKGLAQAQDSVFLYNGQVLVGEVQGISVGVLNIDDLDLKTQKIKLTKIKKLRTEHTAKIETIDRQFYLGVLSPDKDGWVSVNRYDSSVQKIRITDINLLISLQKGFFKRLNGSVSAGFSYTKSNNLGQLTMSSSATYATRHLEYELSASENASIDSGKFSRDREDAELFSNYNLYKGWLLGGALQYQRNLELAIARRYQELLGVGNKVLLRSDCQIILLTGITVSQELSTDGVSSGPLFEIPLMFRFNFFKSSHPNLQVSTSQTLYIGLTESGRVRFDGSTSASWQIVRNFYLSMNPYTNYDNRPPAGSANFDYGVSFSISYQF